MTVEALTDCPYYLLTRASLTVTAVLRRRLSEAGAATVRPAYLGVLMALWHEDGVRNADLGRRVGLEPSTMTGLLDRMERDGLVTREPDPEDRRAQRICLTPEGTSLEAPVDEVVAETLRAVLDGVPPEHLLSAKTTLRRILTNAKEQR